MRLAFPEGCSPRTLFATPYHFGLRLIDEAFLPSELPTCERVLRGVVGVALCIPLINTITFVALRALMPPPPLKELTLDQLERLRDDSDDPDQINAIEWIAAELLVPALPEHKATVGSGLRMHGNWMQAKALLQGSSENLLCGYYALFFALQCAQDEAIFDAEAFNARFKTWSRNIAQKRISLKIHRKPFKIDEVDIGGLSMSEFAFLLPTPCKMNLLFYEDDAGDDDEGRLLEERLTFQPLAKDPESSIYHIIMRLEGHYHYAAVEEESYITAHSLDYPSIQIYAEKLKEIEGEFRAYLQTLAPKESESLV